jgi:RimJ/RimL family protein N-acetyltransferase
VFEDVLTDRLHLRSLKPDDAEAMFAYRSNPAVVQYQSWEPKSLQAVRWFITDMTTREFNTPGWYQIGIALAGDDRFIGDCGIHVLETDSRIAEIGITIAPASQSMGYATEALHAIFDLLFVRLGKHRVFASVDPCNLPSMALMERIGLRKEGHFVQSLWFKDSWVDDIVFATLASEWSLKHHHP